MSCRSKLPFGGAFFLIHPWALELEAKVICGEAGVERPAW